jgi:hypothetical protein
MPCFCPLHARYVTGDDGKRHLKFSTALARSFQVGVSVRSNSSLMIPCGRCMGCKLERSRQWAVRCMHESSLHKDNCFITLTYEDRFLPPGGTLLKSDFQDFMKRLRFQNVAKVPSGLSHNERDEWLLRNGIRFFQCGEYGELNHRPHYHAILFNFDFPDKKFYKMSGDHRLFTSKMLDSLWDFKGICTIGDNPF